MIIKIGKMPGTLSTLALNDGATVKQAAETADINYDGYEARINGSAVSLDTVVYDGQTVLFVQKIKGNAEIFVKVGRMPGTLTEVACDAGTKVAKVLELAGITVSASDEVRMSGVTVSLEDLVATNGATILVVAKIKGNN
jgi:sulfur carrier protein ThiS